MDLGGGGGGGDGDDDDDRKRKAGQRNEGGDKEEVWQGAGTGDVVAIVDDEEEEEEEVDDDDGGYGDGTGHYGRRGGKHDDNKRQQPLRPPPPQHQPQRQRQDSERYEELRKPPYPDWQLYALWKGEGDTEVVDGTEPKAKGKAALMAMRMAMRPSMIRVCERTFFDAVVLCVWTDLLGPRCRHLWLGSNLPNPNFHEKLLKVLPRLTTGGELTRNMEADGSCASRYYRLPAEGFELGTFVFLADVDGATCPCALSLVKELPPTEVSRYLKLFGVCRDRMATLVKKFVAQLKHRKEGTTTTQVLLRFTDDIGPFMIAVNHLGQQRALGQADAPQPSPFADTALDLSESIDGATFHLPRPFLDICITCHLQTAGRSVIVGEDSEPVRRLLRTLALFLTQAEQETVRYDSTGSIYEPDLVLQVVNAPVDKIESQVLDANHPTTIIDPKLRVVRRTHNRDVYTVEHEQREHAQLSNLEAGRQADLPASKLPATRRPAPLVRSLLETLLYEPTSCHAAVLTHFSRSLQRTALVLIELASGCRATSVRVPIWNGHGAERPLPAQKRDKMRQALQLHDYHDFEIVLAMCWKLDNDSYARILGDDSVREDQLSSFLGSL
ncbi:hypothetical protein PTSG_05495 [Salpingoeca rosetta]|uniref:Uncharacterized protein n=1 Tax=Salpingoeca rosetta (strain ATCC 50818 / BSB-021) TaxID=946362 RepID=F2UBD7_SALR5|nr:uncharacterized protein PTSG_05495 [Salpingoeca rosetta]EGD73803.1 hypothetical protein PTSG_05495 [Salpingoeca rosetta]|eukprot:XP_004993366.1 hypothetical protein PTSG_05495 [Salpingoeca rosetta]